MSSRTTQKGHDSSLSLIALSNGHNQFLAYTYQPLTHKKIGFEFRVRGQIFEVITICCDYKKTDVKIWVPVNSKPIIFQATHGTRGDGFDKCISVIDHLQFRLTFTYNGRLDCLIIFRDPGRICNRLTKLSLMTLLK